jgi:ATP-binding protein involved in chromosome partitioning
MKIFSDFPNGLGSANHHDGYPASAPVKLANPRVVIAFGSARGGCGKSVLVANLAGALALAGVKVGILDADLNAPSIPGMLGIKPFRMLPAIGGIEPAAGPLGLRIIAANLIPSGEPPRFSFAEDGAEAEQPAVAPVSIDMPADYSTTLTHMAANARFGNLDLVLIDLAAGIDHIYRAGRLIALDGVIVVSTPTGAALTAARNAAAIPGGARTIGILENMAGFNCDNCHSVRPLFPLGGAMSSGPPLLGRLPFDPRLAECAERGTLFVKDYPETPAARLIVDTARRIEAAANSLVGHYAPAIQSIQPK